MVRVQDTNIYIVQIQYYFSRKEECTLAFVLREATSTFPQSDFLRCMFSEGQRTDEIPCTIVLLLSRGDRLALRSRSDRNQY